MRLKIMWANFNLIDHNYPCHNKGLVRDEKLIQGISHFANKFIVISIGSDKQQRERDSSEICLCPLYLCSQWTVFMVASTHDINYVVLDYLSIEHTGLLWAPGKCLHGE